MPDLATEIEQVRCDYTLDASVEGFLAEHSALVATLIDGASRLRDNFGAGPTLRLSVLTDDFGSETLYAAVMWPGDVNEVRRRLDKFDAQWWMAHSSGADGLVFTYELV